MRHTLKLRYSLLVAIVVAASSPAVAGAERDEVVSAFLAAKPYQEQPLEPLQQALQTLLEGDADSVFLPGSRLAPPCLT